MMWARCILLFIGLLLPAPSFAYRMAAGEYYVGAGFGMNVNVARMDKPSQTPGMQLPLWGGIDYLIDSNWGVFGSIIPSFAVGSVGLGLRGGAKYWFTHFDFPLFPYVSLALAPSFLVPFTGPNHINLGLSPGVGVNYFIVAKFMVGAHVHVNPSIAWSKGERQFEFSIMPFFDLALRL